jgi:hypothetical protein
MGKSLVVLLVAVLVGCGSAAKSTPTTPLPCMVDAPLAQRRAIVNGVRGTMSEMSAAMAVVNLSLDNCAPNVRDRIAAKWSEAGLAPLPMLLQLVDEPRP